MRSFRQNLVSFAPLTKELPGAIQKDTVALQHDAPVGGHGILVPCAALTPKMRKLPAGSASGHGKTEWPLFVFLVEREN